MQYPPAGMVGESVTATMPLAFVMVPFVAMVP
jgi:hypothetical protein